jgi:hypothetical protein
VIGEFLSILSDTEFSCLAIILLSFRGFHDHLLVYFYLHPSKSESTFPGIVVSIQDQWEQPGWCFLISLAIYAMFTLLLSSLWKVPLIVLTPFVILFGSSFNDILLMQFLWARNVTLMAAFLRAGNRKGPLHMIETQQGLLFSFFAFGTIQFKLSPLSLAWFTAQGVQNWEDHLVFYLSLIYSLHYQGGISILGRVS